MLASRGDEIGLNAPSQPTGILSLDRVFDAGWRAPGAKGSRSPLSVRSTLTGWRSWLEFDGSETKPAAINDSTTAVTRQEIRFMECTPTVHPDSPRGPISRARNVT